MNKSAGLTDSGDKHDTEACKNGKVVSNSEEAERERHHVSSSKSDLWNMLQSVRAHICDINMTEICCQLVYMATVLTISTVFLDEEWIFKTKSIG